MKKLKELVLKRHTVQPGVYLALNVEYCVQISLIQNMNKEIRFLKLGNPKWNTTFRSENKVLKNAFENIGSSVFFQCCF